jgi:hypothetical protein
MADSPKGRRPKNREVENEMVRAPAKSGEPPRPATEPRGDSPFPARSSRRGTGKR